MWEVSRGGFTFLEINSCKASADFWSAVRNWLADTLTQSGPSEPRSSLTADGRRGGGVGGGGREGVEVEGGEGRGRGKLPAGRRRLEALTQDKYSAFIIKPLLQSSAFNRSRPARRPLLTPAGQK